MTFTHLSQTERYQSQALMKAGQTQTEIARILVRHKSTINKELARSTRPPDCCAPQFAVGSAPHWTVLHLYHSYFGSA